MKEKIIGGLIIGAVIVCGICFGISQSKDHQWIGKSIVVQRDTLTVVACNGGVFTLSNGLKVQGEFLKTVKVIN